jgi:small subunit ribosomal protein S17
MRTIRGTVTSTKMDKTAVVTSETRKSHSKYKKIYTQSKKYFCDDPENKLQEGQVVVIGECRPISKNKNWKLLEILK